MFQKTSKTLFYMKIMVFKIPPGGRSGTLSGHWPKRVSAFCVCKNKGAYQLHSSQATNQRLSIRYIACTVLLLSKSEITIHWPSSVAEQPGLFRTWSGSPETDFSHDAAHKRLAKTHIILLICDYLLSTFVVRYFHIFDGF